MASLSLARARLSSPKNSFPSRALALLTRENRRIRAPHGVLGMGRGPLRTDEVRVWIVEFHSVTFPEISTLRRARSPTATGWQPGTAQEMGSWSLPGHKSTAQRGQAYHQLAIRDAPPFVLLGGAVDVKTCLRAQSLIGNVDSLSLRGPVGQDNAEPAVWRLPRGVCYRGHFVAPAVVLPVQ